MAQKLIGDIVGQIFFVARIYVSRTLNVVVWEDMGYPDLTSPFCWGSFRGRAAEQGRETWSSVALRRLLAANFEVAVSLQRVYLRTIPSKFFGWNLNIESWIHLLNYVICIVYRSDSHDSQITIDPMYLCGWTSKKLWKRWESLLKGFSFISSDPRSVPPYCLIGGSWWLVILGNPYLKGIAT